jgi:hypothetical protein
MPGFYITGREQGNSLANPNSKNEVRRTHRWVFDCIHPTLSRPVLLVLKSAQRPSVQTQEAEMHHNQEQIYYAGKHTWEPISLSWYDVEQGDGDVSYAVWQWYNQVVDFNKMTVAPPNVYKATIATLQMLDGEGNSNETWSIYNGWPSASNWNALDYTGTELQLIEVKYRFDRALKTR